MQRQTHSPALLLSVTLAELDVLQSIAKLQTAQVPNVAYDAVTTLASIGAPFRLQHLKKTFPGVELGRAEEKSVPPLDAATVVMDEFPK